MNRKVLSDLVRYLKFTDAAKDSLALNSPKLYGAAGYENIGPKLGMFMPINKKKDPVSGNMVESIGTRYRGLGKYNRRMEVWQVGGAGEGLKVTDIDDRNT